MARNGLIELATAVDAGFDVDILAVMIDSLAPLVAERLRFAAGELAVVRRRVRYLDGQSFYSNDSYFPLAMAEGTALDVDIAGFARASSAT
jgi:DNA-binding GntR family transcriptional regulator